MKITLTPKAGTSAVAVDKYKYDIAMAKGDFDAVNDIVRVEGVDYALSTQAPVVELADIYATGATANQIIKRNAGATAWEFAADAIA